MPVRIYEGDKNETGGDGIEVTENKVINIILRTLNNLIQLNDDNELYTDLQLDSGITTSDTLPVGVTTGRVLVADGRPAAGTMLCFKVTSGSYVCFIYGDNNTLYIDNGTGTWKNVALTDYVDDAIDDFADTLADVATSGSYEDLDDIPGVCTMTVGSVDASYIGTVTQVDGLVDGATVIGTSNGLIGLQGLTIAGTSYTIVNGIDSTVTRTHFYGIYKEGTGVIIFSYNNN